MSDINECEYCDNVYAEKRYDFYDMIACDSCYDKHVAKDKAYMRYVDKKNTICTISIQDILLEKYAFER